MKKQPDSSVFPKVIDLLATKLNCPVEYRPGGWIVETYNIKDLKSCLDEAQLSYLDAGETILFWDNFEERWMWIAISTAPLTPQPTTRTRSKRPLHWSNRYKLANDGSSFEDLGHSNYVINSWHQRSTEHSNLMRFDPLKVLLFAIVALEGKSGVTKEYFFKTLEPISSHFDSSKLPAEAVYELFKDAQAMGHEKEFLEVLIALNCLEDYFPELAENAECEQDPEHHTDDVLTHLLKTIDDKNLSLAYDSLKDVSTNMANDMARNMRLLSMAALLHDIGKARTKESA